MNQKKQIQKGDTTSKKEIKEEVKSSDISSCFQAIYRISVNGSVHVHLGQPENKVEVTQELDWSLADAHRSYRYPTKCYDYHIYVKKGYNVKVIGGLLTFFRGEYRRSGTKCIWILQDRGCTHFRLENGYVVREEHVKVSSLHKAVEINRKHRAILFVKTLKYRAKQKKRMQSRLATAEAWEDGEIMLNTYATFEDSLRCGNCRPGTTNFAIKYFAVIGRKVDRISLAELRAYGHKFGVSVYTERLIRYKLAVTDKDGSN